MQDEEAAVVKVCRFVDLSGENLDVCDVAIPRTINLPQSI